MVPLIAASNLAVSTAMRIRIAESCRRDLSKVFVLWLREDLNHQPADLLSIAAKAAKREGAGQDFQSIAILAFAADAGVLSDPELAALKKGLTRLAGRSPVVNGVPMPFCADAVGILGVALGTAIIADAEITGQVVGWAMRFLKSAYERDRADDWQRCLLAAADLKMGTRLKLSIPNGVAVADVRLALMAKGLIHYPEAQVRQDAARVLETAIQEPLGEVECERAALCLAGVEWVIRQAAKQANPAGASTEHICTNPPQTLKDDQQGESGEVAHRPEQRKKTEKRKLMRRNERYERIDKALRDCAASRPRSHGEVFQLLDSRKVTIPNRRPFKAAGGWFEGFQQDRHAASVWLSLAWGKLSLPAFRPGPKK
jgi:hypothetical protein